MSAAVILLKVPPGAQGGASLTEQQCHRDARRLLVKLEKARKLLREDRRLSVMFIKPFILYQMGCSIRNVRAMLPRKYTYRHSWNIYYRRKP